MARRKGPDEVFPEGGPDEDGKVLGASKRRVGSTRKVPTVDSAGAAAPTGNTLDWSQGIAPVDEPTGLTGRLVTLGDDGEVRVDDDLSEVEQVVTLPPEGVPVLQVPSVGDISGELRGEYADEIGTLQEGGGGGYDVVDDDLPTEAEVRGRSESALAHPGLALFEAGHMPRELVAALTTVGAAAASTHADVYEETISTMALPLVKLAESVRRYFALRQLLEVADEGMIQDLFECFDARDAEKSASKVEAYLSDAFADDHPKQKLLSNVELRRMIRGLFIGFVQMNELGKPRPLQAKIWEASGQDKDVDNVWYLEEMRAFMREEKKKGGARVPRYVQEFVAFLKDSLAPDALKKKIGERTEAIVDKIVAKVREGKAG